MKPSNFIMLTSFFLKKYRQPAYAATAGFHISVLPGFIPGEGSTGFSFLFSGSRSHLHTCHLRLQCAWDL